ncbi:unnamed protein product [Symbiodinium pilosum]|uniref:Tyrosine specific protein phosphatases domain-containing protein n=1 Tax=Symbiodinium pilosum TaxID=2952 RepID=A0A812V6G0_SYMPI|nr:unnamed protein product [Symbiodinium pilosum]
MAASSQVCKAAVWTAFGSLALCWLCSQKLGMTSLVTASPQPRRFSEHANWLLPGHLMIGRYPYLNPVYCMSQQDADAQLRSLLDAGVTTFVCLQSEIPPQIGAGAVWPKSGVPVRGFAGSFMPYAAKAQRLAPDKPLQFLHCPIQDLNTPQSQELSELVADLSQRMEAGEVIYLHCWGGRGRSGVVAACLLGRFFNLPPAECLRVVQDGYSSRGSELDIGALAKSPQTDEQRQFVKLWLTQTQSS